MAELKMDKGPKSSEGMRFTQPKANTKAPFDGRPEEEQQEQALPPKGEAPEGQILKAGKVPLHPAVVRLPASVFGRIGTEALGYPGFTFTDKELEDLAELWAQTGVEMSPMLQAAIGTSAMFGGKVLGYYIWKKMGSPPIPGAEAIGKETPGEEED